MVYQSWGLVVRLHFGRCSERCRRSAMRSLVAREIPNPTHSWSIGCGPRETSRMPGGTSGFSSASLSNLSRTVRAVIRVKAKGVWKARILTRKGDGARGNSTFPTRRTWPAPSLSARERQSHCRLRRFHRQSGK